MVPSLASSVDIIAFVTCYSTKCLNNNLTLLSVLEIYSTGNTLMPNIIKILQRDFYQCPNRMKLTGEIAEVPFLADARHAGTVVANQQHQVK